MTFQRYPFPFGSVVQCDFIVSAEKKHVAVILIDIYDLCILVGVKFSLKLVALLIATVFVLEK